MVRLEVSIPLELKLKHELFLKRDSLQVKSPLANGVDSSRRLLQQCNQEIAMSKIDPTMVDVDAIIDRIKRVQAGELPKDNVSIEELRAAIEAQRQRREAKIVVEKEPKTG